jgi:hypothetical protein
MPGVEPYISPAGVAHDAEHLPHNASAPHGGMGAAAEEEYVRVRVDSVSSEGAESEAAERPPASTVETAVAAMQADTPAGVTVEVAAAANGVGGFAAGAEA